MSQVRSGRPSRGWLAIVILGLALFWIPLGVQAQTFGPPKPARPAPSQHPKPGPRAFHLGFTPMPYGLGPEVLDATYDFIARHGDLIAHHLDDGVPWPEALANGPYPADVEVNLAERVARLQPGQTVYLAVTLLDLTRQNLAGYWSDQSHGPMPPGWENKAFDDPDVITAYTNFCRDLIGRFHPDYMAYGIELSESTLLPAADFAALSALVASVSTTLHAENPGLPLFLTFEFGSAAYMAPREARIRSLMQYSDYFALSLYTFSPEAWPGVGGDPSNLPADWLTRAADLAGGKPLAIAETGELAETFDVPSMGLSIPGTEPWQQLYVQMLLQAAQQQQMEFVVWFVPIDYDRLWLLLEALGFPAWMSFWRDNGLLDGALAPRPALADWDDWAAVPHG